jgi:hypothetical protein
MRLLQIQRVMSSLAPASKTGARMLNWETEYGGPIGTRVQPNGVRLPRLGVRSEPAWAPGTGPTVL